MEYRINNKTYNVDRIIYVEEDGNDSNDGSILAPVATIHQAVRLAKSSEYTVIEVGKGTFTFTSYYNTGSGYLEAILHDAWKPIIFIGKGLYTTLVLNQLSYRPTYENRHYKIQLGNSKTILTNFIIDINFPSPSGSAWGPNVWNPLFHLCVGTICNNIFRIKTTTTAYGYYNDSSGVPKVYNNVFAGSYSLSRDYSGTPVYINNFFLRTPQNGSNSYYSALESSVNTDIMNGDFESLIKLSILGSPNLFNPNGTQSILGPFGGELAMQLKHYLFVLKMKDQDKYIIPTSEHYESESNNFKVFKKQDIIDLLASGYINFFQELCRPFICEDVTITQGEIIDYTNYEICILSKNTLNELKVKYNSAETEASKNKSKLTYDYGDFFEERFNGETLVLDISPTNDKYENKDYIFTCYFNSHEDLIKNINVNLLSNKYNLLSNVEVYKKKDSISNIDTYFVKFKKKCDKAVINVIANQEFDYAKDTLEAF